MLSFFRKLRGRGAPAGEGRTSPADRPYLPPGTRIYAIGDVHGRADLLRQVFERIDADSSRDWPPVGGDRGPRRIVEVLIGDYVDRGPDSRGVIDAVLERQASRHLVCLSGNHEDLMLDFLREPTRLPAWRNVGARETLLSYGVPLPARLDGAAMQEVAARFREALPPEHQQFLSLPALSHEEGGYYFAHAGVRPGVPLAEQAAHDLLWIRDEFLNHAGPFGRIVIHGHTPAEEPEIRSNRINIDTGAVFTGKLSCLVLQDDDFKFL
jgi:serine/threonine protein phosphatase 1